jgi:exodeoxyribonuclease V gamma subunit
VLRRPARAFLRQRLGVAPPQPEDLDRMRDDVQADLGPGLARWQIGDRLLRERLRGRSRDAAAAAERGRGELPPGPLGARALEELLADVEPLVAASQPLRQLPVRAVDVTVPLADGRRIRGTVGGIHGDRRVQVTFSRLGARHLLEAWVELLVLAAAEPGTRWSSVSVGHGSRPVVSRSRPPAPAQARALLDELVLVADLGLRGPLPMTLESSSAYAQVRHGGGRSGEALSVARAKWGGNFGDGTKPENEMIWGVDGFDLLTGDDPRLRGMLPIDDRTRSEPSAFGALACLVWLPLFGALEEDGS